VPQKVAGLAPVFARAALIALASTALLPAQSATGPRVHDPSTCIPCGTEHWCFFTGIGVRSLRSMNLGD